MMHDPPTRAVALLIAGSKRNSHRRARFAACILSCWLSLGAAATEVRLAGDRIEYRGTITEQANAQAKALHATANPRPSVLWIESQGGSTRAALELGSWTFLEKLSVQIDTFCFSSCANYVFTAGDRKLLAEHASLVWHGGPAQGADQAMLEQLLQQTLQQLTPQARADLQARYSKAQLLEQVQHSLQELIDLEARFFSTIRVDPRITTLGQLHVPAEGGPYVGWDYSLNDLATLGVGNIHLENGAWHPVLPLANTHVFRLELAQIADFVPRIFAQPDAS